jgi:hypothetical protein
MPMLTCVAALQTSGSQAQPGNPPGAMYFGIALAAVVVALVVLIFIRVNARRSGKR